MTVKRHQFLLDCCVLMYNASGLQKIERRRVDCTQAVLDNNHVPVRYIRCEMDCVYYRSHYNNPVGITKLFNANPNITKIVVQGWDSHS